METDRRLNSSNVPQRRFVALVVCGLVGAVVEIPHLLLHMAEFLAGGALIVAATAIGTVVAPRVALGTPVLDAVLTRRPFVRSAWSVARVSIVIGLFVALVIVALDIAVFTSPAPDGVASRPPLWTGALAALYGGFTEELVLRYGLMSLGVSVLAKVLRGAQAYWAAIVVAALVFGLWHLWAVAGAVPLTPASIMRTVLPNSLAGTAFGWLYWRRGLEAAMCSHGVAAFITHVAVPSIGM